MVYIKGIVRYSFGPDLFFLWVSMIHYSDAYSIYYVLVGPLNVCRIGFRFFVSTIQSTY